MIEAAFEDARAFSHNAGFIHVFADTVARVCEESFGETQDRVRTKWLEHALVEVDRAIELDRRYAKYYCTRGRLLAQAARFDEALQDIRTAVDREDSSRADYAIRIGEYQYHNLRVQALKNEALISAQVSGSLSALDDGLKTARTQIDESMRRMDDSRIQNLEFLGFFAALVSFTIGSIQLALSQEARQTAALMLVLVGALLTAFAGFGFVIHRDWRRVAVRSAIMVAVGAVCMGVGMVVL